MTSTDESAALHRGDESSDDSSPADDSRLPALDTVLAKSADENFPVGPGFLPKTLRADLMAIYGYARFVDDIGDETDASADDRFRMLDLVDADLTDLFAGRRPKLPPL